jgi:hypothetical protein
VTEHITAIKGHGYKTEVFPLKELVDLELKLGGIMGGAAGPAIDYLSGLFSIDKGGVHLQADADKSTDSRKLGRAIAAVPAGILEAGGYAFVERILSRTSREVDMGGEGTLTFTPLSAPYPGDGADTWMEHIYPGRLGELHLAVMWVLMINFSPFGRGASWSLKQLWSELQAKIPAGVMTMVDTDSDGSAETPTPTS